jgi:hypothetical protein
LAEFDPYYVWLGIPPKNQPPDHYRLLGIEIFEPDARVIESAADRQMAHVKTFQTGKNGSDSQRILNHLSQARNCLLNPDQKALYDAALRQQHPPTPPAVPQPPGGMAPPMAIPLPPQAIPYSPHAMGYPPPQGPFPMAIPVPSGPPQATFAPPQAIPSQPIPAATPSVSTTSSRPRQKKAPLPLAAIAAAGAIVFVVAIGVLWRVLANSSGPTNETQVSKSTQTTSKDGDGNKQPTIENDPSTQAPPDSTQQPENVAIVNPGDTSEPSSKSPTTPEGDPSTTQPSDATPSTDTTAVTGAMQVPSHFAELPTEPLVPTGPTVSILKLMSGPLLQSGGASIGTWQVTNGELHGVNGGALLPVQVPPDYQLELTVSYIANDAHLVLGFPVAGRPACVVLNWSVDGTTVSGFHQLDGIDSNRNESTFKARLFQSDKPSRVRCVVRGNFVQMVVDDKTIIQWRGDTERLTVSPHWQHVGSQVLSVASGGGDVRISRIEMTPLQPLPVAPRPAALFDLAPARKFEPPTTKELQLAKTAARREFSKEFAASKLPPARRQLAKSLVTRAEQEKDGLAMRVGLWTEAQALATNNFDPILACQVIDEQAKYFELDALAMRTKAVEDAAKEVDANIAIADLRNVIEATCTSIDLTVAGERFDLAKRLGVVLKKLSAHKKFGERRKFATKRLADLAHSGALFEAAQAASGSDTAEAKRAIGNYQCFVQGNWSKGLPLLAEGDDSQLASVAKLELDIDAGTSPDESKYRKVGDAWWLLSLTAAEPWNEEFRRQARYWYEKVPQQLSAPELQERITEIEGIAANRYRPGLVAAAYVGDQYGLLRRSWINKNIARSWQTGSPDASIWHDNFTIVWNGTIQAPIPGKYYLSVNSDDGSRMDLDGKTLWDDLGGGSGLRGVEVDLTGEPQQIVLHYHEGIVHAHCALRWRLTDETEDRIVESQFLRHDPIIARRFYATDVIGNYRDTVRVPSVPEGGLLVIFEDQQELPAALPEDTGPMELDYVDRYSGEASLRVGNKQRYGFDSMGIRAKIREVPGEGEYRFARFALKKVGGGPIAVQFHGTPLSGAADWRRYHTGPDKSEFPWGGASIAFAEDAPTEWTVVTRDLFADHGEFDVTGLALTAFEQGYALFDHIYLARSMHDFEKLGEPATRPANLDTSSSAEQGEE